MSQASDDAIALLRGNRVAVPPEPPVETPDRGLGGTIVPARNEPQAAPAEALEGVAVVPTEDLILSGEALQLLLDKDPLSLTTTQDGDIDRLIAYERDHRRRLEAGLLKKGQRPTKAKKKPANVKSDNSQQEVEES